MKKAILVGGGEFCKEKFLSTLESCKNPFIIAVDSGYNYIKDLCKVNMVVGDFDSLGFVPHEDNIKQYNCEKDFTDMALAIEKAIMEGCDIIDIFGGLGGRTAHSIANFQICKAFCQQNKVITIFGQHERVHFVKDNITISGKIGSYVSVFAMDEAKGVSYQGLKYPLNDYYMHNAFPLGVSNEFAQNTAKISVEQGVLLVFVED